MALLRWPRQLLEASLRPCEGHIDLALPQPSEPLVQDQAEVENHVLSACRSTAASVDLLVSLFAFALGFCRFVDVANTASGSAVFLFLPVAFGVLGRGGIAWVGAATSGSLRRNEMEMPDPRAGLACRP